MAARGVGGVSFLTMTALKSVAKAVVPARYHRALRQGFERFWHLGLARYCPCCGAHVRAFETYGASQRPGAMCPVCGSLERHRMTYLYLREKTDLLDGRPKRLLHVAPEPQLSRLFQTVKNLDYLSADLRSPRAMVKMDVTAIQFPDDSFDVIYCSHVLEHVPDDRKAMREFYRVLKPGGWAVLLVPITADATFEDPTITSPEERLRLFGQRDHLRRYGPDYKDRLAEAGFSVTVEGYVRELDEATVRRFGLLASEDVYVCRKL